MTRLNRLSSGLLRIVIGLLALGMLPTQTPVSAAVGKPITNYYTLCEGGTPGTVSTWHGKNRDGKPPFDPDRRTYDFRCKEQKVYAPAGGTVFGTTQRFGGVVLVTDAENSVCMVFLGMTTIEVKPNQAIKAGTYIGTYRLFHFTAVQGDCKQANWYDVAARERERPIRFIEFGEVLDPGIRRTAPHKFESQNPTIRDAASAGTDTAATKFVIALNPDQEFPEEVPDQVPEPGTDNTEKLCSAE